MASNSGSRVASAFSFPALDAELGVGSNLGLEVGLDNAPSIRILRLDGTPAFFAKAVNLKCVPGGRVTVLVSNLPFDFSDFL